MNLSLGSSKLVISGGLAELFSGSISMGLGAYLAAATDRDHYFAEKTREQEEVAHRPEDEKAEIYEILHRYGIGRDASDLVIRDLERNPEDWVQVRQLSIVLAAANAKLVVYDGL